VLVSQVFCTWALPPNLYILIWHVLIYFLLEIIFILKSLHILQYYKLILTAVWFYSKYIYWNHISLCDNVRWWEYVEVRQSLLGTRSMFHYHSGYLKLWVVPNHIYTVFFQLRVEIFSKKCFIVTWNGGTCLHSNYPEGRYKRTASLKSA
jgi:hypothetical protein